jgi:hypothetical protein
MSYSFNVQASDKQGAKVAVAAKLQEIVDQQPVHAADLGHAATVADAFIDLLADDDTKDVYVSMNGYVSWNGAGEAPRFSGASLTCGVSHVVRKPAQG